MNSTAIPVSHGTAERLAQLAYLGTQHHPRTTAAEEIDDLAFGFIGSVDHLRDLWENLREDCMHLWWVQSGHWSEDDIDDLSEADEALLFPNAQGELAYRVQATRERLTGEIEDAIHAARTTAVESRRTTAVA